jgi:hypothetical protein
LELKIQYQGYLARTAKHLPKVLYTMCMLVKNAPILTKHIFQMENNKKIPPTAIGAIHK